MVLVDISTLDCPYGCGHKLVIDPEWNEDQATCSTNEAHYNTETGEWTINCEGEGVFYKNADEVCDTVNARLREQERLLTHLFNEKRNLSERIYGTKDMIKRITNLSKRISNQHG